MYKHIIDVGRQGGAVALVLEMVELGNADMPMYVVYYIVNAPPFASLYTKNQFPQTS